MASPMREKRVWPPQRDADGESVAAFEAAVAVVKETVVRSGEVLVSAKEDLNDHQRWLKAQTEAVLADRERHDRWLQRQRERQEVLERREQKRARRRAARQAAVQAVGDAIGRVLFAIRSAIWSVIARIVAGFRYLGASIGGAFGSVFAQLRRLVASFVAAVGNAFGFAGVAARAVIRSTSTSIAFGVSAAGAKVQHVAPSAGGGLSVAFGGVAARAKDASRGVRRSLGGAFAWLSVQADAITHKIGETLAPAGRTIAGKAYALMPALWDGLGKSGLAAKAVIDHHVSQDDLGALRLVDTTAEATGRLVWEAARALGAPLSAEAANYLFAALATDTGWFRHSNTTPATFALALTSQAARPSFPVNANDSLSGSVPTPANVIAVTLTSPLNAPMPSEGIAVPEKVALPASI